jgi:hypothetical protein
VFCAMSEEQIADLPDVKACIANPELMPPEPTAKWFIIHRVRTLLATGSLTGYSANQINSFLRGISQEFRFALLVDLVPEWGMLGADDVLLQSLKEVTGL